MARSKVVGTWPALPVVPPSSGTTTVTLVIPNDEAWSQFILGLLALADNPDSYDADGQAAADVINTTINASNFSD